MLDASRPDTLRPKLVIKTDGNPEGYAEDATRGLFYTNLEDKNRTVAFDIRTHRPHTVNTDGELTTRTPARFRVIAAALAVFVPRAAEG